MTDLPTDQILSAIAERRGERRRFLTLAGTAAVGAGGLSLLAACGGDTTPSPTPTPTPTASTGTSDLDVLNFALNLEYLEAQFYSVAAFGTPLSASLTSGAGATAGAVTGGAKVPFADPLVAQYAREIALDEAAHVAFLKGVLGGAAVAQPALNIAGDATGAFTAAARAAGVVGSSDVFNPYADDVSFLLGAFIFEDVGVTAYKGASPLISNKTYLEAAAGILAAEAYHAGLIRSVLYRKGIATPDVIARANKISAARDSLDGATTIDQGIGSVDASNIVPADANAIAFSRSTGQVLNITYLSKASVASGGFFPAGVNGNIRMSAASG